MKRFTNLRLLLSGLTACAVLLAGCVKQSDEVPTPDNNGQDGDNFDFATTTNVKLEVDYSQKGNKALFEVYAENPVTEKDGVLGKKDGVKALLKVYTDRDCKYSGLVNLPSGTEKVWLYSEAYGLPTCMEAEVTANGISFDFGKYIEQLREKAGSKAAESKAIATRGVSADNPYNIQFLGTWNNAGQPYYMVCEIHNGYIFPIRPEVPDGLNNRIQNVLMPGTDNAHYAKPTEEVNIQVTKNTELNLVFLAELSAYRNAIGYYYYDKDNAPKSQAEFDALPKYLTFPNCSSPSWDAGVIGSYYPMMVTGDQVKLVYYGQDGKTSSVFPAGTTVGWFILPDGYEVDNSGNGKLNITGSKHAARYSNNEFNPGSARYMVNLYDEASGKTVLGFEDSGDGDYKDVLFYVDASQAGAIGTGSDKPSIDPDDEKYPDVTGDPIEGTWAFEDLWPNQGDYDMNDVVVAYSTVLTTDKDNNLVSIKNVFTPLHCGGQIKSAFGYQIDFPATAFQSVNVENGSSSAKAVGGLESGQAKAVIMLFDDIRQAVTQGPITVDIKLAKGVAMSEVTPQLFLNPFICVSETGFVPGEMRREVHLTNYPPTSLADLYPFGKYDDKSSVDKQGNPVGPYYYVTSDLHPFAIDLPITDYHMPDEMVKIDDFYPQFPEWVKSKGEKNKDWYLHPGK